MRKLDALHVVVPEPPHLRSYLHEFPNPFNEFAAAYRNSFKIFRFLREWVRKVADRVRIGGFDLSDPLQGFLPFGLGEALLAETFDLAGLSISAHGGDGVAYSLFGCPIRAKVVGEIA